MKIESLVDLAVASKDVWLPLVTALIAWLAHSKLVAKLPKPAREWLGRIGEQNLLDAITEADKIVDASPEERRQIVVERIQREVQARSGLRLPTSVANILVEYGVQLCKKARK